MRRFQTRPGARKRARHSVTTFGGIVRSSANCPRSMLLA
jgi:hypothetical protein